jgi:hypothetical protein
MKLHTRMTPQQIRTATEELLKRHQANFDGWLDERKVAIANEKLKSRDNASVGFHSGSKSIVRNFQV